MTTPDLPPLEWTSLNLSDLEWNRAMIRRARERLNDLERLRDGQRIVFGDVLLDKGKGSRDHRAASLERGGSERSESRGPKAQELRRAVENDKDNNREVDLWT